MFAKVVVNGNTEKVVRTKYREDWSGYPHRKPKAKK